MEQPHAVLTQPASIETGDYETVRRVIEKISQDWRDRPSLEALADDVGMEPTALQKLFTRWAGLSPKAFCRR